MKYQILLPVVLAGFLAGACAQMPSMPINTTALTTSSTGGAEQQAAPVRGTPVVAGRPARVFIVTGFKEKDCAPLAPQLTVTSPPKMGNVSFKPNQSTTVQFSASGKCMGKVMPGTGIYYTARAGAVGVDTFTVSAATGSSEPATKTFQVRVVD